MHRAILTALALILATLVVSHGCANHHAAASSDQVLSMLSGDWVLRQIGGQDVSSMLSQGTRVPNLSIGNDGAVSGFAGVNRITSRLNTDELAHGGFKLSPVAATRMAGPPEAMDIESRFTEALTNVTGFKVNGSDLSLTRGAETLLKFARGS